MKTLSATDTLVPAPEDGQDAVRYWLVPTVTQVVRDSSGTAVPSTVGCTKMKQVGGESAAVTTELTLKYQLSTGSVTAYSGAVSVGSASWLKFLLYDGSTLVDSVTVAVVSDGAAGASGPLPYPCGAYDSTVSYTRTAYMAPVVGSGSLFYLQLKVGTIKGIDPASDVAANGGNWAVFDMFKYLMSEVAFINFGKLASAIFYGRYMFSQYGVDASDNAVETEGGYKDFNGSDPMADTNVFRPNILLDFLSGKAWFNDIVARGEIYATKGVFSGYIRNNIVSIEASDAEPVDSNYSDSYTAYKLKDNLYVDATFNEVVLPCDDDYSGARVLILDSYFVKTRTATNPTIIRAESGSICCGSLETSSYDNLVSAIQIDSGAVELIYQSIDDNGVTRKMWFVLSHSAATFKIYS